ncbi:cell division protein FtsN [Plesiomonas shigelloides]|uniref:cell division protein FtsN n=1 Tax=Plesiomonas shigelloides TaxID=703 RepID=UPI001261C383|nr:cell division protein FtsN [Plesiomonas shigelloides]KAB7697673.1 cell division protein FtsN [Plesiomonas shigelloides]
MLNLPVNPSDLILTVAQRDYVSRGKRSAPARTRRNNKKARKPLPVMAIGLAVLLIAGLAGGLYYLKHRSAEQAQALQQQPHKNGLPVKPEERWSYIKELENKEVVVTDHNPVQDSTPPTQLSPEQQAILSQLQAEMKQAPITLPQADRNGNIDGETRVNPDKPLYTPPTASTGQTARVEQIPPRPATPPTPPSKPVPSVTEAKPVLVQPPPIPRNSETSKPAEKPAESSQKWLVQCGAYRTSSQAEEVQATLAFQGIESNVRTSNSWHRVVLGPYSSRAAADKQQSRLKGSGMSCLILPVQG